jgi:gamma-glutamyl:cysteine ligase YbdK (ATP-grasp superfamily)
MDKTVFTLGIEEEFQIVDPESRKLVSHMQQIVDSGKIFLYAVISMKRGRKL